MNAPSPATKTPLWFWIVLLLPGSLLLHLPNYAWITLGVGLLVVLLVLERRKRRQP